MRRMLFTGGAGFVGSHLCERLVQDGHEVVALDDLSTGAEQNLARLVRERAVELEVADVAEPVGAKVDAIFHLACPASPVQYQSDPCRTLVTAFSGTRSVLERARELGVPVVVASTSEIYGEPDVHPQPESYRGNVSTTGPRSCYDEGKRCSEALAAAYSAQHGVDARIVRIFNTYGPRMKPDDGRVVSNFVVQALEGRPLTVCGDGEQTRSFCYVDDLVEGLVRVMRHPHDPGPINLGNPVETTMRELAERVLELIPSTSVLEPCPRPADDPTRRQPDITRAEAVLGWRPRVPLARGLAATVDDFRKRLGLDQGRSNMEVAS